MCVLTAACARGGTTVADGMVSQQSPRPNLRIECEGRLCGSSVGLFVSAAGSEPVTCTAALVGQQHVVTASHCLTQASHCDDVWVGFPRSSGEEEWVSCVEIESISTPKGELLAPDFALIRVDRVEHRKPLMISQVSLEVGEVVEMVALNARQV